MYQVNKREFFLRSNVTVARELLGKVLFTKNDDGITSGIIVETESYGGTENIDLSSHSYKGATKRNKSMFKEGGYAYVYQTYGIYYCVNVSTEKEGIGSAVLIRAIEPREGIEIMKARRKVDKLIQISNGPGKVSIALNINKSFDGEDIIKSNKIWIEDTKKNEDSKQKNFDIITTTRIGISKSTELDWRFFIVGNPFVSKKRTIIDNIK